MHRWEHWWSKMTQLCLHSWVLVITLELFRFDSLRLMDWQEMTLNTYAMLLINDYFVSWVDSGPRNTKQKLTVCVSNFVFHEQYCGTIDKYRERWIIQIWNISFPLGRWCLQTAQLAFQSIYPRPSCLSMWISCYSHRQTRRCRPRRPWSTESWWLQHIWQDATSWQWHRQWHATSHHGGLTVIQGTWGALCCHKCASWTVDSSQSHYQIAHNTSLGVIKRWRHLVSDDLVESHHLKVAKEPWLLWTMMQICNKFQCKHGITTAKMI